MLNSTKGTVPLMPVLDGSERIVVSTRLPRYQTNSVLKKGGQAARERNSCQVLQRRSKPVPISQRAANCRGAFKHVGVRRARMDATTSFSRWFGMLVLAESTSVHIFRGECLWAIKPSSNRRLLDYSSQVGATRHR
jgi:hypothetical protein